MVSGGRVGSLHVYYTSSMLQTHSDCRVGEWAACLYTVQACYIHGNLGWEWRQLACLLVFTSRLTVLQPAMKQMEGHEEDGMKILYLHFFIQYVASPKFASSLGGCYLTNHQIRFFSISLAQWSSMR